jgi:hypothetical protein
MATRSYYAQSDDMTMEEAKRAALLYTAVLYGSGSKPATAEEALENLHIIHKAHKCSSNLFAGNSPGTIPSAEQFLSSLHRYPLCHAPPKLQRLTYFAFENGAKDSGA